MKLSLKLHCAFCSIATSLVLAVGCSPAPPPETESLENHLSDPAPEKVVAPESAAAPESAITPESVDADTSWQEWPTPDAVLFVSGDQHGYIEPCGCTGLENQKGGLARRHTLLRQIEQMGSPVIPVDVGNQVRRVGQQAGIKFQTTISALKKLGYHSIGFGPDDIRLDVGLLLSEAAGGPSERTQFVSANVTLLDPTLLPRTRIIDSGGLRIGITSVLETPKNQAGLGDEIVVEQVEPALRAVANSLNSAKCDIKVLMYYGGTDAQENLEASVRAVQDDLQFDLAIIANEFGEPLFEPRAISDTPTKYILTGHKGMHACLVGFYKDAPAEYRYQRIALTDDFEDSEEMLLSLKTYQDHLKNLGLEGLGIQPIPHPSGREFVGTEKCGECHTTAMEIWESTPHSHATESIVHPPNSRGEIARHFDPECLSCHVTGWNAQQFYPYTSGYASLDATPHMVANGCENCHGPGSQHVAAEEGDIDASEEMLTALRKQMILPYEKARERCMDCHDLDNSPDFHKPGAFEEYWEQVKHEGKD